MSDIITVSNNDAWTVIENPRTGIRCVELKFDTETVEFVFLARTPYTLDTPIEYMSIVVEKLVGECEQCPLISLVNVNGVTHDELIDVLMEHEQHLAGGNDNRVEFIHRIVSLYTNISEKYQHHIFSKNDMVALKNLAQNPNTVNQILEQMLVTDYGSDTRHMFTYMCLNESLNTVMLGKLHRAVVEYGETVSSEFVLIRIVRHKSFTQQMMDAIVDEVFCNRNDYILIVETVKIAVLQKPFPLKFLKHLITTGEKDIAKSVATCTNLDAATFDKLSESEHNFSALAINDKTPVYVLQKISDQLSAVGQYINLREILDRLAYNSNSTIDVLLPLMDLDADSSVKETVFRRLLDEKALEDWPLEWLQAKYGMRENV